MSLKKGYTYLFFLGLFFFSFNSFEGVTFLGEFNKESGIYFLLLGFFLLVLSLKIYVPIKSSVFRIILLFVIWCMICTILNFNGVSNSYMKHTPGVNRFIRQYLSLIISSLIIVIFYSNVLKGMSLEHILTKVRFTFLLSLIVAFIIGFFETLAGVFGISAAQIPFILINYFPFFEKTYFADRISSISYEPPFLAIYLITVCGWMFSYIITHKDKGVVRLVPSFLVLFLTYFSGSRTALIVILIQFLFFLLITVKKEVLINYAQKSFLVIGVLITGLFIFNGDKIIKSVETKIESLDFLGNLNDNVSNKSRLGIQYASLKVFSSNPIIGVGFGQQSYYNRYHYPGWATKNNYEFTLYYKNPAEPSFPPGYNLYARLLAETGIIGIGFLFFLIYYSFKRAFLIFTSETNAKKILALILLVSFIGLYINWLQIDTFRIYGVWLSLAILIRLTNESRNE